MNLKTKASIVLASIPLAMYLAPLWAPQLLPSIPSLPKERVELARVEPVIRVATPNHALTLVTATVDVRGEALRRRGPCLDRRISSGTVTVRVLVPPSAVSDGDIIEVDQGHLEIVTSPNLTMIADDGACSRLAHLVARPTSSPSLNREAETIAVNSAKACATRALLMVGGLQSAVTKSLQAWSVTRPVRIVGVLPINTCLTSEVLIQSDQL
jgi:hypothetical protein